MTTKEKNTVKKLKAQILKVISLEINETIINTTKRQIAQKAYDKAIQLQEKLEVKITTEEMFNSLDDMCMTWQEWQNCVL